MMLPLAQSETVYRIEGPDGKLTFSDAMPKKPGKVTLLTIKAPTPSDNAAPLPYQLRQIANKYPVTLFTSKDCVPCDDSRSMLVLRGVPFTEKTISTAEESDALQRLAGTKAVPFLTLGEQKIKNFNELELGNYLSAAGYPEKSQLPSYYTRAAPTPLIAEKVPTPMPQANLADPPLPRYFPTTAPSSRVNPSNPAGIEF